MTVFETVWGGEGGIRTHGDEKSPQKISSLPH